MDHHHSRVADETSKQKVADEMSKQNSPVPRGRLADRIQMLRKRCIEGLGEEKFTRAYSLLKENENNGGGNMYPPPYLSSQHHKDGGVNEISQEEGVWKQLEGILGKDHLHYQSLIDQLLFVEESFT